MRNIFDGSGVVSAGVSQALGAVGRVLGSIPLATLPTGTNIMSEADARIFIAKLRSKYSPSGGRPTPSKVKLGDFDDDAEALRRDWLVLGEDMKKAERRLTGVG